MCRENHKSEMFLLAACIFSIVYVDFKHVLIVNLVAGTLIIEILLLSVFTLMSLSCYLLTE